MSATSQRSYARRALLALTVLTLALTALLAGALHWSDAQATPKLGLDLRGGFEKQHDAAEHKMKSVGNIDRVEVLTPLQDADALARCRHQAPCRAR